MALPAVRPGDRASDCGGKMAPVGLFARPNGEQVILHRCLGCGFERRNRVAADDSAYAVMQLRLVAPRTSGRAGAGEREARAEA